jgi:hypothetical protein
MVSKKPIIGDSLWRWLLIASIVLEIGCIIFVYCTAENGLIAAFALFGALLLFNLGIIAPLYNSPKQSSDKGSNVANNDRH